MIRHFNAYVLFPFLERIAKREIAPKLIELQRFAQLTLAEQEEFRRKELHKILSFSRANVPYYQDLFKSISFDENKVLKDIKYVEDLPLLTKDIIRENVERIRLPAGVHARKTGGSTGQSAFFYYDNPGLDWASAMNLYAYELAGNYPHLRDCHISSELGIIPPTRKDRFLDWLKLFSQNRKRIMIRSFSEEDLEISFRQLKAYKPYLVQGHPSSAYAIASYIKQKNLKKHRYCHVFEPSGETLTPKMAETIAEYIGCRVVNRYGNAEFGVMAHSRPQDPYTKLQVFNRAFYIEPTEKNAIIASNFTNYSFPLFRYDTGDIATVRNEADGSFIYDIQGRIHDLVRIDNEDYATHYLMDYLDHKIRRVREFQVLIRDQADPLLNVVPEDENDKERIRQELKARWPSGLDIDFINYEDLKKMGWRQKFRHIVDLRGRE